MRIYNRFTLPALLLTALVALAQAQAQDKKPTLPEVGKPAPEFAADATSIATVLPESKASKLSLKDLKGKNVVLFFYPKALTKGCTVESCGFRDRVRDLAKLDTVVVGVSTDPLSLQEKFTKKEKLNFPLLDDESKEITKAYGALNLSGKASRYTFVIDKKGVLRKVYTKVMPLNHPGEVVKYVEKELTEK